MVIFMLFSKNILNFHKRKFLKIKPKDPLPLNYGENVYTVQKSSNYLLISKSFASSSLKTNGFIMDYPVYYCLFEIIFKK